MANIASAKKKVRQDIKREHNNKTYELAVAKTMKQLAKGEKVSAEQLQNAFSIIDKAAKQNIIHGNKAARLKSKISRLSSTK